MKAIVNLLAIISQFFIVIFVSSKYGITAGVMVVSAIVLNAVQVTCAENDDSED